MDAVDWWNMLGVTGLTPLMNNSSRQGNWFFVMKIDGAYDSIWAPLRISGEVCPETRGPMAPRFEFPMDRKPLIHLIYCLLLYNKYVLLQQANDMNMIRLSLSRDVIID